KKGVLNTNLNVSHISCRCPSNTAQTDLFQGIEVYIGSKQMKQFSIKHTKISTGVNQCFGFERPVLIAQGQRNKRARQFTTADSLVFKGLCHTRLANMRKIVLWHFKKNGFFVAFFNRL